MCWTDKLLDYRSCSVVGMAKNTGKTTCLNYLLAHLPKEKVLAVTSIGVDGEQTDCVTQTPKPEIFLREHTLFATSESHYRQRLLDAEVLQFSRERTALGRVVIARTRCPGKVLLSGPSSSAGLRRCMTEMQAWHPDLLLVDGALSRLSPASPAVSESMVLTTGAAFSANMPALVQQTALLAEWIRLPQTSEKCVQLLLPVENGLRVEYADGTWTNPGLDSALALRSFSWDVSRKVKTLYLSGALTDSVADVLLKESVLDQAEIIVRDFTRIFLRLQQYRLLLDKGFRITVLQRTELLALCVNPVSPSGYVLDSDRLCASLSEATGLPVVDLCRKERKSCGAGTSKEFNPHSAIGNLHIR